MFHTGLKNFAVKSSVVNDSSSSSMVAGLGYYIFGIVYSIVAVGVSGGAVYVLRKRKADLS